MSKGTRILIAVSLLAVLGYIVYSSMALDQYSCEVCMEFRGRTDCRKAVGATEAEALRTALDTACAQLSSGMTDTIACSRTPPKSVACEKALARRSHPVSEAKRVDCCPPDARFPCVKISARRNEFGGDRHGQSGPRP